jgi:NAD-dependent dihydropyrimidine dehydrogenase PreA subunit
MAYVIAEPCIGTKDTACVDACPVDCIHPKKDEAGYAEADQLFIDPVECIDCGACVPVCPVSAIFAQDDLPEKWAHFTEKNAALRPVDGWASACGKGLLERASCLPGCAFVSGSKTLETM